MTDLNATDAAMNAAMKSADEMEAEPSGQPSDATDQYERKIADLSAQICALQDAGKNQGLLEDRVLQLLKANQKLVVAAIGAQELQASAEAASRQQEAFLATLAHELRDPLTPIALAAELLNKIADVHPQIPKLHGIIDRQVAHMTRLVDDLLDASRFSSGKVALQKRPLLLANVIALTVEACQPVIDKRNQRLIVSVPAKPIVIDGDQARLVQIFSNLLINASKFSPEHEQITVSVHALEQAVIVSVKDNGIGIAPEVRPFIFDMFTQGFRSQGHAQGGLGVGLALVRTIIQAHGGTVTVDSAGSGFGSKFTVVLPISTAPIALDIDTPPKQMPHHPRQILIIEDNADANEILKDFLTLEGHTVTTAQDGVNGLSLAKNNSYDVIICDIVLPGMDGFEVITQLRHQLLLNRMPCFIAVSSYNQQENRTRAIEVGFDHFLVKPIATDTLLDHIASATR